MTYIQTITSLDGTVEVCLCASCTLDLVDRGVATGRVAFTADRGDAAQRHPSN